MCWAASVGREEKALGPHIIIRLGRPHPFHTYCSSSGTFLCLCLSVCVEALGHEHTIHSIPSAILLSPLCISVCLCLCLSLSVSVEALGHEHTLYTPRLLQSYWVLSVSLSFCLSVCPSLSVCIFICLSVFLSVCLSVCLSLSLCGGTWPRTHYTPHLLQSYWVLSVSLSLSFSLSVCLSVCLSVFVSVCLSVSVEALGHEHTLYTPRLLQSYWVLSVSLSVCLSVCVSVCFLSACLSVCLCLCLYICLSLWRRLAMNTLYTPHLL